MGEPSNSVPIDMGVIGGKEFLVQTSKGSISVFVCGDQEKPVLITYPDVGLNHTACYQGLFYYRDAASLLLHNFCIYHIDPPGHEIGAASIPSDVPWPTVDDLADQVAEVLDFFGIKVVTCLGAIAGAYILTLFAMKYRERVLGLILVSPLCKAPSWTDWFYSKVMLNLLYFAGMSGLIKEWLLHRYFGKDVRCGDHNGEYDIVQACRNFLDERQSANVMRFLSAINQRCDLKEVSTKLECKILIFVGESSPFYSEAIYMNAKMDRKSTLVEVQACGSLVTEERPQTMPRPIREFLMELGLCRPFPGLGSGPTGPRLSISPEMLSPKSLGLKLKPIKTNIETEI